MWDQKGFPLVCLHCNCNCPRPRCCHSRCCYCFSGLPILFYGIFIYRFLYLVIFYPYETVVVVVLGQLLPLLLAGKTPVQFSVTRLTDVHVCWVFVSLGFGWVLGHHVRMSVYLSICLYVRSSNGVCVCVSLGCTHDLWMSNKLAAV